MRSNAPNAKKPCRIGMAFCLEIIAGDHLISHTVTRAVPSAQRGLTSVFEMGTGDPSQYSHRQTCDGAWRVVARSLSATSSLSRMVSPGPSRNADCNLAPKFADTNLMPSVPRFWRHARRTKLIGFTRLARRMLSLTARS